jgi:hypothetical protein
MFFIFSIELLPPSAAPDKHSIEKPGFFLHDGTMILRVAEKGLQLSLTEPAV